MALSLAPDVIVAHAAGPVRALLQATRTVPIVFPVAGDPVGAGLVESLARPGGIVTGFMNFDFSFSGKWLEVLKQIAPSVTRVAVLRDPVLESGTSQFAVIQAVAPSLRMEVNPVNMRDAGEIERAITAFAPGSDGGLIVTAGGAARSTEVYWMRELSLDRRCPLVHRRSVRDQFPPFRLRM